MISSADLSTDEKIQQIAAEESVMQMLNRRALEELSVFNLEPTVQSASRLLLVPSLYNVLMFEASKGRFSSALLAVCKWIGSRGEEVLKKLIIHSSPPVERSALDCGGGWKVVCIITWTQCIL
jgi:hypothetical protein